MNGMFTDRIRRVLKIAREEALNLNSDYIGTEHLLLGLIKEGSGVAVRILEVLGLDLKKTENKITMLIKNNSVSSISVNNVNMIPFTVRAKRVLENSATISREMEYNFIGTEHLLLGLASDVESQSAIILRNENITFDSIKKKLNEILRSAADGDDSYLTSKKSDLPQLLISFGRDLTEMAEKGKLDPIIGREKEIERVTQVLSRRKKNNPVLIGEPGVGKTAVIEGLAQRIIRKEIPEVLENKRIVMLDMASVVAGTKYRGQFEERIKAIVAELQKDPSIIIFIDELHTIVGAGGSEGSLDASNIFKPALSRGEIQCIGATTFDEYRKYIEKDGALERRFQTIMVEPPSTSEAVEILKGLQKKYEKHHKVQYTDEAIYSSVVLSERYVQSRFLPDKAIDIIDEAGAKIRLDAYRLPPELTNMEDEIEVLEKKLSEAVNKQDYERAAEIRDMQKKIREKLIKTRTDWKAKKEETILVVDEDKIRQTISTITGVPIFRIESSENKKLLDIEKSLTEKIIGQDLPVSILAKSIRRSRTGLRSVHRPIGVHMFLGTSGVGKTELAKQLAEYLFGSQDHLIRLDMSEYMEKFNVSKLIGAPPGYVGFNEGGQLTEKVRRKPYCIILLDEIEKAHPDIFNILLQIMEDGTLTDASGLKVSFRNCIVIMTTNVGVKDIVQEKSLGFSSKGEKELMYEDMKKKLIAKVKDVFNPEFINRVDEIIVFNRLSKEDILKITANLMNELKERMAEKNLTLSIGKGVKEFLAEHDYDVNAGARTLRRNIQKLVEDPLAESMLRLNIAEDAKISLRMKKGEIQISIAKKR